MGSYVWFVGMIAAATVVGFLIFPALSQMTMRWPDRLVLSLAGGFLGTFGAMEIVTGLQLETTFVGEFVIPFILATIFSLGLQRFGWQIYNPPTEGSE